MATSALHPGQNRNVHHLRGRYPPTPKAPFPWHPIRRRGRPRRGAMPRL